MHTTGRGGMQTSQRSGFRVGEKKKKNPRPQKKIRLRRRLSSKSVSQNADFRFWKCRTEGIFVVAALFFRLRGKVCKHLCLGKSDQEKNVGVPCSKCAKQAKKSILCTVVVAILCKTVKVCNFKQHFFEMLRTVASPETFVLAKQGSKIYGNLR